MRSTSTTGRTSSLSPLSSIETRYRGLIGLLLISPWLAGLVIFKLVPILASSRFPFQISTCSIPARPALWGSITMATS